jgi:hypothetical protein
MTSETQVKKILQLVNDIKNLLPLHAENKLTLHFATEQEIKNIAASLNVSYMKPSANFTFHWCLYKSGPVNVHIQTQELEEQQTPLNLAHN